MQLIILEELEDKPSNVNLLLLQMGDSELTGSSSDGSGSESLSWMADHMDWDFESDETDPAIIFKGPQTARIQRFEWDMMIKMKLVRLRVL